MTWQELITDAFGKIGAARAGDDIGGEDLELGLRILTRILDDWNAERPAVYSDVIASYTLTANLTPHTIGPTGTLVTTQRPVSIEGAAIVVNSGTSSEVRYPVNHRRDRAWWNAQAMRRITSSLPTDLYYDASYPNGTLNLWPVPDTAYALEIVSRLVLATIAIANVGDTIALPPGYTNALLYTLAEEAAPDFGQPVPSVVVMRGSRARARIFGNNRRVPSLRTCDSGVPTQRSEKTFNYLTRSL